MLVTRGPLPPVFMQVSRSDGSKMSMKASVCAKLASQSVCRRCGDSYNREVTPQKLQLLLCRDLHSIDGSLGGVNLEHPIILFTVCEI